MQPPTVCFLCSAKAQCDSVRGTGGTLIDVSCTNECPRYQIQRQAGKKLGRQPALIPDMLKQVKALHAKNAEDVPVILIENRLLKVETRSQQQLKGSARRGSNPSPS